MTDKGAFKKKVREYAAANNINYTTALRRLQKQEAVPSGARPPAQTDPIRGSEPPILVFVSSKMDEAHNPLRAEIISAIASASTAPWAFEAMGAASYPPGEFYLSGVRDCDVFVWMTTGTTTEPVAKEVREALRLNKRILCFIVGEAHAARDDLTRTLLAEVQTVATTANVPFAADLDAEVAHAIVNEAHRAFREPRSVTSIATGGGLEHGLNEAQFEAQVAQLIEDSKNITLQRFIDDAIRRASALDAHDQTAPDQLAAYLDELGHLGVLAVRWNERELLGHVVQGLVSIFQRGYDSSGLAYASSRILWLEMTVARAYAIAAEALRRRNWTALRTVVLNPAVPRPTSDNDENWFEASRLRAALARQDSSSISSLNVVLLAIQDKEWANPKTPYADPLREEIAQVDALTSIAVNAPRRKWIYYASYRAYTPEFYEPILVRLIEDSELQRVFGLDDDIVLGQALRMEASIDPNGMARLGGWSGYHDKAIKAYLEQGY